MKEIKDYSKKLEEEIDLHYMVDAPKAKVGKCEIRIPRKVIRAFERKSRFYEVSDVNDLNENYTVLSKSSFLPIGVFLWLFRTLPKVLINNPYGLKDETLDSFNSREYRDLVCEHPCYPLLANLNTTTVDNVYLENFEFTKKVFFEACEFDIRDRDSNYIRGVYVCHKSSDTDSENNLSREQLAKVLNAPESTTFDLGLIVLSEWYRIIKNGRVEPRGKKVRVSSIHRFDEDKIPTEPSYNDSFIKSKIFQLVE